MIDTELLAVADSLAAWEEGLDEFAPGDDLEKGARPAIGSPGGKRHLAKKIAALIPEHDTYVEPFCGGAAVFFSHEPSAKEVLADANSDIMAVYRFLKAGKQEHFRRFANRDWAGSERLYRRVHASKPLTLADKAFRTWYVGRFGWQSTASKLGGFVRGSAGKRAGVTLERLLTLHERLKNCQLYCRDAIKVIKQFDSPTTFFYLDPPYIDKLGALQWTEEQQAALEATLRTLKGKFILSQWKARPSLSRWHSIRVRTMTRPVATAGRSDPKPRFEVLVSNFPLTKEIRKAEVTDGETHAAAFTPFTILKAEPERVVIAGYASPYIVDKEHHRIGLVALKDALPKFMAEKAYRNVMILHSNVQVGHVVEKETDANGKVHTTHVDEKGLYAVAVIDRPDLEVGRKTIDLVRKRTLDSWSIAGRAQASKYMCESGECFHQVTRLELYEFTLCEEGKNPAAKFVILKAEEPGHEALIAQGTVPIHSSGVELGELIKMDDVLDFFTDPIMVSREFISLEGSLPAKGQTEGDIDLLIKKEPDELMDLPFQLRVIRAMDPEMWDRVQWSHVEPKGPSSPYIPLYDLWLVPSERSGEIIQMAEAVESDAGDGDRTAKEAGQ